MNTTKKGFTLIELLIVIAILAVLSVGVIVILNPAELLRQARDSTRISDMAALNSAMALYLTDVTNPYLGGASTTCASKVASTFATTTLTLNPFVVTLAPANVNATTTVDGNGWVSVKFTDISGQQSPLSRLPIDPANSASYMYAYACNGLTYKLATVMESLKYRDPTTGYMRKAYDGGTSDNWYETGNNLAL